MRGKRATAAATGSVVDVLRVAFPLILASSGHALRLLTDRIMLSWYSSEALAAAMPAGLASLVLMSFFMGTAGYVNTFVAQYTGAGQTDRAGLAVWQGLYLSAAGGLIVALLGGLAGPIFDWMGHASAVRVEQVRYFRVLCWFSPAPIALATLLAFWSGRGLTRTVMGIELLSAGLNVVMNYALIFGKFGLPAMGITGAGLATGLSSLCGLLVGLALFFSPSNRARFGTLPRRTLDRPLLWRVIRFGTPNGLQFMLDLAAFNAFVVLLGRAGTLELEAANIAFGLNAMSFIPIIGLGMTASILVGQCIGAGDIPHARRAVRSVMAIALLYSAAMGALYTLTPGLMLAPFRRAGDPGQAQVFAMATVCLRYITAYLVFDAMCITYSHAIKGAGDTRFALVVGLLLSWGTLVLPCYAAARLGASVWVMWRILVAHVALCGVVFYWRYRGGRWESMRVVETAPAPPELPVPVEAIEFDRA